MAVASVNTQPADAHMDMHRALGNPTFRVSLSSIRIPPEAYAIVEDCLDQQSIGQSGYVAEFEREVAAYVGAEHCIAVSSGTLADAVACMAMRDHYGVQRAILPALTFVAQANAARIAGLELEFVDVREDWTLDPRQVRGYHKSEFVFITDIMGRVATTEGLDPRHLVVEDACEALGSRFDRVAAGTFGVLGTFSFYVSHTVTMGEGGAIVTNDPDLAALCRRLRSQGRASEADPFKKFTFPLFGLNAKMSGLTAALGVAVMRNLGQYVAERRVVFHQLNAALGGRFAEREGEVIVPHGYPVGFRNESYRDKAMEQLLAAGIECRKFFSSVPTEGAYQAWNGRQYPVAEHISHTHLYCPCHQNIEPSEVDWMAEQVLAQRGLA